MRESLLIVCRIQVGTLSFKGLNLEDENSTNKKNESKLFESSEIGEHVAKDNISTFLEFADLLL